jgi:hypothetical protein
VKLAIVGEFEGTHLGGSFARAAADLGSAALKLDIRKAESGNPYLRSLLWHLADRRPPWMFGFGQCVIAACAQDETNILIATGAAPLTKSTLRCLRSMGIVCVNFASDDPWNPVLRARWHLQALPEYDLVFSPRRANLGDLERLGCAHVHYLPFGLDGSLFLPAKESPDALPRDVLFVGGADRDRATFMTEFMRKGPSVALVGAYWDRFTETRPYALGQKSPEEVRTLTAAAKINLCLVRRANRDGHVMRSFEIAAIGGCMLTEHTEEHREIFGDDEECVVYFRTPEEAAARAHALVADPERRRRLSVSLRERTTNAMHTYRDRLLAMLNAVESLKNCRS